MKRIAIYVAALAAVLMSPLQGTDVGKLQPVGLIQIYQEEGKMVITTDSGDSGIGATLKEAFENLEETTPGVIFLDTADFLVISRSAAQKIGELRGYLKPSVRICIAQEQIDAQKAAGYLSVHRPAVKLKEFSGQEAVQELLQENGRFRLK